MRYLVLSLILCSAVSFVAAQQERPFSASPRQEAAVDPKIQAEEKFATQMHLLHKACDEGDVASIRYYQSAVLMAIRLDIEAGEQVAVAGQPPTKDLVRKRAIMDAFEGFYFQPGQGTAADPKFALLDEYRALLK